MLGSYDMLCQGLSRRPLCHPQTLSICYASGVGFSFQDTVPELCPSCDGETEVISDDNRCYKATLHLTVCAGTFERKLGDEKVSSSGARASGRTCWEVMGPAACVGLDLCSLLCSTVMLGRCEGRKEGTAS